ncbi:DnaB Replicative DNA helicase [uncultured Caudovirales phage]|uniref:DnaB-like replicative helicase n=1 Tax=uncultured Caudovirales phage TaxID=2100421 RepID=A0A6J7WX88_9CAUD|nr:DnaB Replicative DNA helicase [uncultured Caudovirales phage]
MRIEQKILSNLVYDEQYCRKVIPFLKKEYFSDRKETIVASEIVNFFNKYNKPATKEILSIEVSNRKDLNDKELAEIDEYINNLSIQPVNEDWMLTNTEKFCKDRAVYNAILASIKIIDGNDKQHTQDAIPTILSDALAVSFDNHIGHDYLDDHNERYDFYHRVEEKIAFDLEMFNKITKGGLSKKTLNIALAGTGVGKSLFMCHVAGACLNQGLNVLYITMEMAEERIAERIDANLLNLTMDELKVIDKDIYENRISKITNKTKGKLIIKEYPTASAHAGHFRALLEELKMKREFKPDIIFIDYLNICSSQRMKQGGSINSYTYIKSIAEELRGLAVEYNVPIVSATQTTRSGFTNSDPGLEDTSESFGLPATADFMFALVSNEELEGLNQIIVKQLKNRYNDLNFYKRFVVGIDRAKMKLYDVEASAQTGLADAGQEDDTPMFDKSNFGRRQKAEGFEGFKF